MAKILKFKDGEESCLWEDIVRDAVGRNDAMSNIEGVVANADQVILEFRKRRPKDWPE